MQIESVYKLTVTENFVGDKRMLHTVFWWQHLGICVDINLVLLLCWWQYKIIDLRGFDTILRKGVTLVTALCCWLYHKYKPKLSPTKKKIRKIDDFWKLTSLIVHREKIRRLSANIWHSMHHLWFISHVLNAFSCILMYFYAF